MSENNRLKKETVYHVSYASDTNYAPIAAVSMISLMEHNKEADRIVFHYLSDHLTDEIKDKIFVSVQRYGREVFFYDIDDITSSLKKEGVTSFGENHNYTAYARLFLPELLNYNIEKILYLDCDTLIFGSLKELYDEEMDDYVAGAVKDIIPEYYCQKIGLNSKEGYINSGVLLINLREWRKKDFTSIIKNILRSDHCYFWYADQDLINCACHGEVKILDLKYNCLSLNLIWSYKELKKMYELRDNYYDKVEVENARRNPIIVHLVPSFFDRPWQESKDTFMKKEWREYLDKSEFAEDFKYMKKKGDSLKRGIIKRLYKYIPKFFVVLIIGTRTKRRIKNKLLGEMIE